MVYRRFEFIENNRTLSCAAKIESTFEVVQGRSGTDLSAGALVI